jgi:hypothetical protein
MDHAAIHRLKGTTHPLPVSRPEFSDGTRQPIAFEAHSNQIRGQLVLNATRKNFHESGPRCPNRTI